MQNAKIKSEIAMTSQKTLLKQAQKELLQKDSQITKMSEIVEELRNNRLISPEDAKFLNVNLISVHFFHQKLNIFIYPFVFFV